MTSVIRFKRGTAAAWSSANPILALGEPGWDLTNNIIKVGDGVTAWNALPVAAAVSSVNGFTGDVTLTKSDFGLGNVDNTSDLDKPISTATQAALDQLIADLDPIDGGLLVEPPDPFDFIFTADPPTSGNNFAF